MVAKIFAEAFGHIAALVENNSKSGGIADDAAMVEIAAIVKTARKSLEQENEILWTYRSAEYERERALRDAYPVNA